MKEYLVGKLVERRCIVHFIFFIFIGEGWSELIAMVVVGSSSVSLELEKKLCLLPHEEFDTIFNTMELPLEILNALLIRKMLSSTQ